MKVRVAILITIAVMDFLLEALWYLSAPISYSKHFEVAGMVLVSAAVPVIVSMLYQMIRDKKRIKSQQH